MVLKHSSANIVSLSREDIRVDCSADFVSRVAAVCCSVGITLYFPSKVSVDLAY